MATVASVSVASWSLSERPLTGLEDLRNLYSVGGLRLHSNLALTSLEALHNLTHVNGDLEIVNNRALTNVDGLHSSLALGASWKLETMRL